MSEKSKKELIIELLDEVKRRGIEDVKAWLDKSGFYQNPASSKWHGNYVGGLAEHSYNVYRLFSHFNKIFKLNLNRETIILCPILHDVCKIGAYVMSGSEIQYNYAGPKGHAQLSLQRIKEHITLTDQEYMIIRYHMGMYGAGESGCRGTEYPLKILVDSYNANKVAKLFYFCDDMASQFLDVKK